MPKGQFGARDLQKHLWKLPIPEFDPDNAVACAIAERRLRPAPRASSPASAPIAAV